ncbi:hypothetical protein [Burkholderia pseudomultivorans]|nr:hypothetical protein [Burkholderia pseudomultivorans]
MTMPERDVTPRACCVAPYAHGDCTSLLLVLSAAVGAARHDVD